MLEIIVLQFLMVKILIWLKMPGKITKDLVWFVFFYDNHTYPIVFPAKGRHQNGFSILLWNQAGTRLPFHSFRFTFLIQFQIQIQIFGCCCKPGSWFSNPLTSLLMPNSRIKWKIYFDDVPNWNLWFSYELKLGCCVATA